MTSLPLNYNNDTFQFKRKRNGVLATGYFNRIGLPGVETVDKDEGYKLESNFNRNQIHFDGDASQLFYPPDMFYIHDGIIYIRSTGVDGNTAYTRVGRLDFDTNTKSIPAFPNVTPAATELEIKNTADKALVALQNEIDVWTRRFYVFAGGDFGANRSLASVVYPTGTVTDDGNFKPLHEDIELDGRLLAMYQKEIDFDLSSNDYGNIVFKTGKRLDGGGISASGGEPVDLSNNRTLHFDMYLVNALEGEEVSVKVVVGNGYAGDSVTYAFDNITVNSTPRTYQLTIPDAVSINKISDLVKFEINVNDGSNEAKVYRLAVTNIWFEWTGSDTDRLFDMCFVKSWNTPVPDIHFGIILQNTCFTYDQTLAMYALFGAGDFKRALILLRALCHVIDNDTEYNDARVRDAYKCGPANPIPTDYNVSLPGWYGRLGYANANAKANGEDKVPAGNEYEYSQDAYAVSTWTGTAGWVMMALGSAYRVFVRHPDFDYDSDIKPLSVLQKLIKLSTWVVDNFKSTTDYFKGYMGGFYGFSTVDYSEGDSTAPRVPAGIYKTPSGQYEGPGQFVLPWRSSEHAADLYAAFKQLYEITGNPQWAVEMRHALEYIDKLWYDGPFDFKGTQYPMMSIYLTGTGEVNEDLWYAPPNMSNLPTDPTVWITYGTDRRDATRLRSLKWLHENARLEGGNPNSMWKYSVPSNGGWIEGAGQVAVLFKEYGLPSWWLAALSPCVTEQLDSGVMYSVTATADTGFNLPNVGSQDSPWKYFREGHIGATSWFLIGWEQLNPFKYPVNLGEPSAGTDDRPVAGFVEDVEVGEDLTVKGTTELQDKVDIGGDVDMNGDVLEVAGDAVFNQDVDVTDILTVGGTVNANNKLNVEGIATMKSQINVQGPALFEDGLTVDGTNELRVNGGLTLVESDLKSIKDNETTNLSDVIKRLQKGAPIMAFSNRDDTSENGQAGIDRSYAAEALGNSYTDGGTNASRADAWQAVLFNPDDPDDLYDAFTFIIDHGNTVEFIIPMSIFLSQGTYEKTQTLRLQGLVNEIASVTTHYQFRRPNNPDHGGRNSQVTAWIGTDPKRTNLNDRDKVTFWVGQVVGSDRDGDVVFTARITATRGPNFTYNIRNFADSIGAYKGAL
jgi:hypothetical protein